ncbi:PREDICTED: glycerate kinase, partial [Nanorana parkeri]|uniref:glycerate kinase n=1 Tax=Nanorana parkeri TaxID=125878 RepID=UPI000854C902
AVLGMAAAAERIVGRHLVRGVISIPQGMEESLRSAGKRDMLLPPGCRVLVMEGAANNMVDEAAVRAAGEIQSLAQRLQESVATVSLPLQVVSLILSDVIGDDLDVIASGPTVPSGHSADSCLRVLTKYNLRGPVSEAVEKALTSRPRQEGAEPFPHVHNILIGSNRTALREAEREAQKLGYLPLLFFSQFQNGRHLLVTGLTGTNVMDVQLLLVRRQSVYKNVTGSSPFNPS